MGLGLGLPTNNTWGKEARCPVLWTRMAPYGIQTVL